ncbi:histone acetyltransferase HAC5 [Raphanus sativus]|uniref:histone acetyltransferase n=1 Tax=Raphanus sativus TaxID=3726 RepID=A0A6J0NY70_RAPSA|nr:histone acetyltransferase HAC5 [Raphanus sativus]
MMASLRATTACAICQQKLEPAAQGWRCQVCRPDYEVCTPCYSKGVNNHPHILITRRPSATSSVAPNTQTNQIQAAQLRAVLLHIMTCCTTQCHYPMCRIIKRLMNHGVTCKKRVCNPCKRMWDLFHMHARNCRDPQCSIPKCREFKAIFSRNQRQAGSRRKAAVKETVPQRTADAGTSTPH